MKAFKITLKTTENRLDGFHRENFLQEKFLPGLNAMIAYYWLEGAVTADDRAYLDGHPDVEDWEVIEATEILWGGEELAGEWDDEQDDWGVDEMLDEFCGEED
jgi:hypothetical protein